jgi:hypothetical protein
VNAQTTREATVPQLFKLAEKAQAAVPKEGLSFDLAQRHIESDTLTEVIELVLSADPGTFDIDKMREAAGFPDEETTSEYGYPEGFSSKSPAEKLAVLTKHFPNLDASKVDELVLAIVNSGGLREGEEELLICPKPSMIANNYDDALIKVLEILGASRAFKNWRDGQLDNEHMRLTPKTMDAIAQMEQETPGDYLVFPVQMGMRHRGKSIRRARVCFEENEFGLGPLEVACYLLTTPERFGRWEDLGVDCAGIEYRFEVGGGFDDALCFYFYGGRLRFSRRWIDRVSGSFGSASGFLR